MPHTSSAKKYLRKTEKRRLRNRAAKKVVKTQIKKVLAAVDEAPEVFQTELRLAIKRLDKAAARRVMHPNTAARKKSQLAKLFNSKTAAAAPATATV